MCHIMNFAKTLTDEESQEVNVENGDRYKGDNMK